MVTLGRNGGALLTSFVFTMVLASGVATAQSLPPGWTNRDVGSPVVPGNSQASNGTYTVKGAGTDIAGTSDQFQYCYRSITGDFDIRVRVDAMQNMSSGAKFGLMFRETMDPRSANVMVLLSADRKLAFQWRTKSGRATNNVAGPATATPVWIRLVRQSSTFRSYSSMDGRAWTQIASSNFRRLAWTAYLGMAVTSHNANLATTGTFNGLSMGNSAPLVPAPWTAKDIGNPGIAGTATESSGTFTVSGAGTDIFNTSDQFQFVYQPVSGDTQIVANVANLQAANSWSKAGVMVRGDLTGSAANVAMFATAAGSWVSQERLMAGGMTYQAAGSAGAPPGWVKVVREGDLVTAFESSDGSTWTQVSSDTVPMPQTVYVGLAVTSRVSTAVATATFTNVSVSTPDPSNEQPTVSITAPAASAKYTAGADITISATAADADGSVAKVDFYAGSTKVGTDTTSPFTVTWNNVAEGTYSLTAVATDDKGLTTTSSAVSVTVGAGNKAPTVSITAPSAGASYTAPASMSMSAAADDVDGTVAKVDFYAGTTLIGSDAASPFSISWDNVAEGTYSVTAVATDDKGLSTTSAAVSVTVNPANKPPTVAITSPGSGVTLTAPASIAVSAGASDTDGSVTRVDFFANGQPIGWATAAPFTTTWSNVPAGTYALTAVATDNQGATATSVAVSVSVAAAAPPPPTPTTISFVPGANYATDATSVTVELRPAGAGVTSTPVATRNLGKPAVVGGEISVDISTLVDPLPTGSYYAIVVTNGPGGSTPSAPSDTFSK